MSGCLAMPTEWFLLFTYLFIYVPWVAMFGFSSVGQTFISVCNQPPRPTQPSIPPGLVNEDQLRLGRKRQVWFIPLADERWGEQVKL